MPEAQEANPPPFKSGMRLVGFAGESKGIIAVPH